MPEHEPNNFFQGALVGDGSDVVDSCIVTDALPAVIAAPAAPARSASVPGIPDIPTPPPGQLTFGGREGDYALWAAQEMRRKALEAGRRLSESRIKEIEAEVGRMKKLNNSASEKAGTSGSGVTLKIQK